MKLLIVCLTLLVAAFGFELRQPLNAQDRSISSEIVKIIEDAREQMPCGFPGLGIPPLAPLRFTHRELHIDGGAIGLDGEFDQFRLDGLNKFEIEEFQVSAIRSRCTFKFNWEKVQLSTNYGVEMGMGSLLETKRGGGAKISIMDINAWGEIRYSLGVLSGNLRVKDIKVYISIGDVKSEIENLSSIKLINRKLNKIVEEWIMLAINDNTDNFAVWTDRFLTPKVNLFIGDRSIGDIIGGSGGGGSGGEPVIKEPCIPPEDF